MIKSPSITPEQLKSMRASAGITQAKAAYLCHAALRTYVQWEAGDRKMPTTATQALVMAGCLMGHIDPKLLRLYMRGEIYKLWLWRTK